MTKKSLGALGIALAVSTILSVPAAAVKILTADSFSSGNVSDKWVTDRYSPEEFSSSNGRLYITVGSKGAAKNRPTAKQGDYYSIQGKKLPCDTASSNTWTAAVRINIDDAWTDNASARRRAEFRVDLVDRNGEAVTPSPTIAIIKSSSSSPTFKYVSSTADSGWRSGDRFTNGDGDEERLSIESGWRTLIIKAKDGEVSYYIDEKKMGSCPLPTENVYPAYMALGVQNNGVPVTIGFDSCTLYDGNYGIRPLSSEALDKQNERLEKSYEKKRNSWEDLHIEYQFEKYSTEKYVIIQDEQGRDVKLTPGKWYKQRTLKSKLHINDKDFDTENSILSGLISGASYEMNEPEEMPDSYWDY